MMGKAKRGDVRWYGPRSGEGKVYEMYSKYMKGKAKRDGEGGRK